MGNGVTTFHTVKSAGAFPKYREFKVEDVTFYVRPLGFRRLFRFWPYFVGDKVKFRIGIKDRAEDYQKPETLHIYESITTPEYSHEERYSSETNLFQKTIDYEMPSHLDIQGSKIYMPAKRRYTVEHPEIQKSTEIVSFRTLPNDILILCLFTILAFIVGGFAGLLLKLLL